MKKKLQDLVKRGKTNIQIAEIFEVHRTTVAKWLSKYKIERKVKKYTKCILCSKDLKNNNHNRRCCATCVTRIRRYRLKKKSVEYKGGKCIECGYDKNLAALVFHHKNPKEKDFSIAQMNHKSWSFIKKELDKCVILCSNCHHEKHTKYEEEFFLKLANKIE